MEHDGASGGGAPEVMGRLLEGCRSAFAATRATLVLPSRYWGAELRYFWEMRR